MVEVCPSCGGFFEQLDPISGWCANCTPSQRGRPTEERWLTLHADEVEQYLSKGFSLTKAKELIRADKRPICLSCNKPIKGGKPNHIFCTTTKECRRMQRRYRTLRERFQRKDHLTKKQASEAAIKQVLKEST